MRPLWTALVVLAVAVAACSSDQTSNSADSAGSSPSIPRTSGSLGSSVSTTTALPETTVTVPPSSDALLWLTSGVGTGSVSLQGSSLIAHGGSVFVAGGAESDQVAALDLDTGERLWVSPIGALFPRGVVGLLHVDSQRVVARESGLVVAYDSSSGDQLWRVELRGSEFPLPSDNALHNTWCGDASIDECPAVWVWPTAAYTHDGLLLVTLNRSTEGDMGPPAVLALNLADGSREWTTHLDVEGPDSELKPGRDSSALAGDIILVRSNSRLYGVDIHTGEVRWEYEFLAESRTNFTPAPLLVDGGVVYAPSPEGAVVALNTQDGEEIWRLEVAPGLVAPIALVNDTLVLVDGEMVRGVEAKTGEELWTRPASQPQGALVADQIIVLADHRIVSLDPTTGAALWELDIGKIPALGITPAFSPFEFASSQSVIAEGNIAVVRSASGLMALDIASRTVEQIAAVDEHSAVLLNQGIALVGRSEPSNEVAAFAITAVLNGES